MYEMHLWPKDQTLSAQPHGRQFEETAHHLSSAVEYGYRAHLRNARYSAVSVFYCGGNKFCLKHC